MSIKIRSAAIAVVVATLAPGAVALAGTVAASPTAPLAAAVQTHRNRIMYTTTSVNVRSGPSSEYGIIRTLPKGTKVTVVGSRGGWSRDSRSAVSWYKLATGGWARADLFTSRRPHATLNDTGDGYVGDGLSRVYLVTDANIRSGPSTDYRIIRTLPQGTELHIVSRILGSDGAAWWEELSTGGWVRADLTQLFPTNKKVGETGDPNCFFGGEMVNIIDVARVQINGRTLGALEPGTRAVVSEEHGSYHCHEIWVDAVDDYGQEISGLVDALNVSAL